MANRASHSSCWLLRGLSLWLTAACLLVSVSAAGVEAERVNAAVSEMGRGIDHLTIDAVPRELMETLTESGERTLEQVEPAQADALDCVTVRNSDGSLSRIAFQQPVKYIDEKTNEIKFIDNTIKQPDSLLARAFSQVAYENTSNSIRVSMPKKLGQGVRVEHGSDSLKMTPATGQEKVAVKKDVQRMDSAETVVEYAGAFGEQTSMRCQPVSQGVKEYIVLEQYTGVHEFQFWLDASGLTPEVTEGNAIRFLNAKEEPVFTITRAWAMDSYTEQGEEGEENVPESRHFDDDIQYRLEKVDNGRYLLTMTVSEEFLNSPDTVYPASLEYTTFYGYSEGGMSYTTVFSSTSETWPSHTFEYIQTGCRPKYGESIGYVQFTNMAYFWDIYPEKISRVTAQIKQTYGHSSSYVIGAYDSNTSVATASATYSAISSSIGTQQDTTLCEGNAVYGWWITNIFKAWLGYEQSGRGWSSYQFMLKATSTGQNYKQFYCSDSNLYFRIDFSEVEHGNGGSYRQVNTQDPNCFGYALLLDVKVEPRSNIFDNTHVTENFSNGFQSAIEQQRSTIASCRRISSYVDDIEPNEYRLAIRAPNKYGDNRSYHVIYQLSDGTWAGKDGTDASKHFGRGNPSNTPVMWENDAYSPSAGTIYFAIKRK